MLQDLTFLIEDLGAGSRPAFDVLDAGNLEKGDVIGNFGEFHPRTIINFDLSYPVVGFELYLV